MDYIDTLLIAVNKNLSGAEQMLLYAQCLEILPMVRPGVSNILVGIIKKLPFLVGSRNFHRIC